MQQSGGSHSQYGGGQPQPQPQQQPPPMAAQQVDLQSNMVVEEASPISSRPPAVGNLDEVFHEAEALAAAGDEPDRGGTSGGNRWPRQETVALIRIRSEMDATFRDATLKGPLWEDVSRKLAELGYKRSAKKCKEKFENVHKYYKRTKEGRAGRQDGKNYKFFSELEALHGGTAASTATPLSTAPPAATTTFTMTPAIPTTTTPSAPATSFFQVPASGAIAFSGPAPISSVRMPGPTSTPPPQVHVFRPENSPAAAPGVVSGSVPPRASSPAGVNVSLNGSSSSPGSEDDEDTEEIEGEPSNTVASSHKRKRETPISGVSSTRQMMQFFERLIKQAMEKQEAMQRRFFEAMERREQDRMIREEAWRRQEMARMSREHELMALDRAAAASRDQAIISFLQQITGQTVPLPQNVTVLASAAPPTPPPSAPPPSAPQSQPQTQPQATHVPAPQPLPSPSPPPPIPQQPSRQHLQQQQPQQQQLQPHIKQQYQHQNASTEVIVVIPEQQVPPQELIHGSGCAEPSPSRWPKAEVLALINLRSELEARYQEAGPKGPLWEEISSGMQKLGYKRNAKRCKEKWENINKYFKKVKESNKKRPEDSKTCPYFHQLDALYRNKVTGGSTSGGSNGGFSAQIGGAHVQHRSDAVQGIRNEPRVEVQTAGDMDDANKHAEGNGTGNKPEDTVKEMSGQHQNHQINKLNEPDSDDVDLEEDEEEDDMDEDEEDEEEMEDSKMAYKIEFQRQNAGSQGGEGNGQPSFMAMVQ